MCLSLLRFRLVQYCINPSFSAITIDQVASLLQFEFWNQGSPHSNLTLIIFELRWWSFVVFFFSLKQRLFSRRLLIWNMRQFFLLFQPFNVYMFVAGNRRFLFFLYILMKYIVLFSNNLNRIFHSLVIEHRRHPVNRYLIKIYKLLSAILRLSYFLC